MKAWFTSVIEILKVLLVIISPVTFGIQCKDPSNTDYCIEVGYNRDKLPPNPPLNITMSLSISVSHCDITDMLKTCDVLQSK